MTNHLLLVSLGPVQDFIASARRGQDLWFGSWLLSDLAEAAAIDIEKRVGSGALVFPASGEVRNGEGSRSVANKIVAVLPSSAAPAEIAEAANAAMRKRLEELYCTAFESLKGDGYFNRERAEAQLEALMEFFWVSVPMGDEQGAYAKARRQAETLLSARKNTKSWAAVTWGGAVAKSSLDGRRESIISDEAYKKLPPSELRKRYGVKGKERLCGVGLFKRLGVAQHSPFPSTTHVASAPLRARLYAMRSGCGKSIEKYLEKLEASGVPLERFNAPQAPSAHATFHWTDKATEAHVPAGVEGGSQELDGYLFYPSRIPDVLASYATEGATKLARGLEELLTTALRAADIGEPPHYYAVLVADGDSMGKALDVVASDGVNAHQRFGSAIDKFAQACGGIVGKHAGSLIYAGGDDVLALLPLHTLLACARELHDAFGDAADKALDGFTRPADFVAPTLSMGIAIAHHLEPIAESRALARAAEKRAKQAPGKDALCITVAKRSGGDVSLIDRWSNKPDERLELWIRAFGLGMIPSKAIFDLERAMQPLLSMPKSNEMAASLAKRVLVQKRFKNAVADQMRERLAKRFEEASDVSDAVTKLSEELQIAKTLTTAYRMAFPVPVDASFEIGAEP